jgi:phage RecT family recombinase
MTNPNPNPRPRRLSNREGNTQPTAGNAPVPPPQPPVPRPKIGLESIQELLHEKRDVVVRAIPSSVDVTADGLIQSALQIIHGDRHLRLCTPKSVLYAVLACAKLGLDFVGEQAYIVPYDMKDNEGRHLEWHAGFMPTYKGYVTVAGRYGWFLDAQAVHANDEIDASLGSVVDIRHRPKFANRGDLIGSYCIVRDVHNQARHAALVMQEEIQILRQDTPAWRRWPAQMVMKCAIKRAFRMVPKTNGLMNLLEELDNRSERQQPITDLVNENASGVLEPADLPDQ